MQVLRTLITCRYSASLVKIVPFVFVCLTYGGGMLIRHKEGLFCNLELQQLSLGSLHILVRT